jgi:chromosome segregation ATPase
MPRNTVLLILAVFLAMLLLWNFNSPSTADQASEINTEIKEPALPAVPKKLTPSIRQEADRQQKQQELAELQQRLTEERAKLQQQTQSVADLKQRQESLRGTAGYSTLVQSRDTEIQNLLDVLSNYRDSEDDVNRAAYEALQNQDSVARATREQLDLQIQQLEQNIRNTQSDLAYQQNFMGGVDVTQLQMQTDQLNGQLADQLTQLNILKEQRLSLSNTIVNNTSNIRSLAEQARNELRMSAANTQEQIFSLRSEIYRLQGAQYQSQAAQSTLKYQISRAQKDLEAQNTEVQSLQQQILNKQSELGE